MHQLSGLVFGVAAFLFVSQRRTRRAGAGAQPFVLRMLRGATVRTGTVGPAPARLDLRGLAPGVYVLTLPATGPVSRRVVVE